jgi:hypothetical protein
VVGHLLQTAMGIVIRTTELREPGITSSARIAATANTPYARESARTDFQLTLFCPSLFSARPNLPYAREIVRADFQLTKQPAKIRRQC